MVTYVIASKATQALLPDVSSSRFTDLWGWQCQMLGEFLEENCPGVTVKVVIKSNEDWGEYIDSVSNSDISNWCSKAVTDYFVKVCRSYGFYERTCPFVYTLEGEYIGDGGEWITHIRQNYKTAQLDPLKEHIDSRLRDNMKKME
mgnify:CR=1 FL=1